MSLSEPTFGLVEAPSELINTVTMIKNDSILTCGQEVVVDVVEALVLLQQQSDVAGCHQ